MRYITRGKYVSEYIRGKYVSDFAKRLRCYLELKKKKEMEINIL